MKGDVFVMKAEEKNLGKSLKSAELSDRNLRSLFRNWARYSATAKSFIYSLDLIAISDSHEYRSAGSDIFPSLLWWAFLITAFKCFQWWESLWSWGVYKFIRNSNVGGNYIRENEEESIMGTVNKYFHLVKSFSDAWCDVWWKNSFPI